MQTLLLLVVCFLAPISAQLSMYTVKNYPDPISRYQACGRPKPSFICDPTGYLPEGAADAIDNLAQAIYNETIVPCYTSGRRKGYIVMIAVMPKMDRYFTVKTKGYRMQTRYREAQYFSYYLGQQVRWGQHSSNCNEMVIILYSVEDRVLYTSTQSLARLSLTDGKVRDTVMNSLIVHPRFYKSSRTAAEAIQYLVTQYGQYLREDIVTV